MFKQMETRNEFIVFKGHNRQKYSDLYGNSPRRLDELKVIECWDGLRKFML